MLHLTPLLFDAFVLLNTTNDKYRQQFLDLFAVAPSRKKKKKKATVIDLTEYLAHRRDPRKVMKQYVAREK